jgi:hypothetical protein
MYYRKMVHLIEFVENKSATDSLYIVLYMIMGTKSYRVKTVAIL